jgi:hypothetical protein
VIERVEQSENVEKPEHDNYHDDGVQDGFNGSLHGDETVHQPQQNTHDDQDQQYLK